MEEPPVASRVDKDITFLILSFLPIDLWPLTPLVLWFCSCSVRPDLQRGSADWSSGVILGQAEQINLWHVTSGGGQQSLAFLPFCLLLENACVATERLSEHSQWHPNQTCCGTMSTCWKIQEHVLYFHKWWTATSCKKCGWCKNETSKSLNIINKRYVHNQQYIYRKWMPIKANRVVEKDISYPHWLLARCNSM